MRKMHGQTTLKFPDLRVIFIDSKTIIYLCTNIVFEFVNTGEKTVIELQVYGKASEKYL